MYVYGGQSDEHEVLNDLWRFSPRTNTWFEIVNTLFPSGLNAYTMWPKARTGHTAVGAIGVGGGSWGGNRNKLSKMVVYGGWGGNETYYGNIWEFTPSVNIWKERQCTAAMNHQCASGMVPGARWKAGVAAFHNLTSNSEHQGTSLFGFGGSRSQLGRAAGYYDMFRYYV